MLPTLTSASTVMVSGSADRSRYALQPIRASGSHKTCLGPRKQCSKCDGDASAISKSCGPGVCTEPIQAKRFATGVTSMGGALSAQENALSLEDAVWCGTCHPTYHRSN